MLYCRLRGNSHNSRDFFIRGDDPNFTKVGCALDYLDSTKSLAQTQIKKAFGPGFTRTEDFIAKGDFFQSTEKSNRSQICYFLSTGF